jgi:organic radical activating enzyme
MVVTQVQTYPIAETFHSLQGEGAWAGTSAFFIRLAGCDVGCVWCDVKESWDAEKHPLQSVERLTESVIQSGAPICVITGGEPTMHNLSELTQLLQAQGIRTHLETSGTQPLTGEWDWITFSPKKFKAPLQEYYAQSHELKVVINHVSDISWAQEHADKMSSQTMFYMQPEWEK